MPEIEIRPVVSKDIPTLAEIEHQIQSNYVWQMDRVVTEGEINIHFREIRLPRAVRIDYPRPPRFLLDQWKLRTQILVATIANAPVGYIALSDQQAPFTAWVTDLAVGQEVRRKGIATALVMASQEWAIQRGLRRMILEMQSKNHAAIRLALKLSFEFGGYSDHYYSNQDIALFFASYLR
ncbi:GNAT family N-acetyltransferase [bacterium]|nr:MAG: GNAT family N-acetyltransferase [bacterium]